MSEVISDRHEQRPLIRVVALNVALASTSGTNKSLEAADLEVAQLTAGSDPNTVDRESADYLYGAAEGLSSVLASAREMAPDNNTVELLSQKGVVGPLIRIAAEPGISHQDVFETHENLANELSQKVDIARLLNVVGLIEPALPQEGTNDKAWQITSWGKQTYLKLLPQIAHAVGIDEAINGARAILLSYPESEE